MNAHRACALLVAKTVLGGTLAVGLLLAPHGSAAPHVGNDVTVDGQDYPVCAQEDCSDQPGQIGVWFDPDTGGAWLSLGEDRSVHVDPGAGGEYVPGTNPLDVFAPH